MLKLKNDMILPMPNVVFHGLFTDTAVLITCLSLAKLGAPANLQGLYMSGPGTPPE